MSDRDNNLLLTNRKERRGPTASMYANVSNITISGGEHSNAGRNIVNIESTGNTNPADIQKWIDRAGRFTDRYGANANAHAYSGYSNGIIRADRVENVGGGKFTFKLDGSSNLDMLDWKDEQDEDFSEMDQYNPEYNARIFNHAQGNQELREVLNSGLGDITISSNTGFTLAERVMETNHKYVKSQTATLMEGAKSDTTKITKNVTNLSGLGSWSLDL
ncbi:hypothetical protein BDQ17DRAFT_1365394 [Cyathus striatus]|nr:hypothetical protein BDQ17DRAFT_1365394 [Cyathus striatus]